MSLIEEILRETPDTKACRLGPGVTEQAAELFKELFPDAKRALVVDDVNTRRVAGDRVVALLKDAGIEVSEYTINPDGSWFHATYDKVEEVRDVIRSYNRTIEQSNNQTIKQFQSPSVRGRSTISSSAEARRRASATWSSGRLRQWTATRVSGRRSPRTA